MKKKLELLEELQVVDQLIDQKKSEQNILNTDIIELQKIISEMQSSFSEQQVKMAELHKEKSDLEAALHTEQENIRRSETNMKEIKTNKEYQAVGKEIAAARKQVSEIEEQLLLLITRMDELNAEMEKMQEELSSNEMTSSASVAEKQALIQQFQQSIDSSVANREILIKGLGNSLVRRYNQLREQRRGQALAEVREGSCLGCNMHLPPQLYNNLFKYDEMYFCPHCQRILLLKQGTEEG